MAQTRQHQPDAMLRNGFGVYRAVVAYRDPSSFCGGYIHFVIADALGVDYFQPDTSFYYCGGNGMY